MKCEGIARDVQDVLVRETYSLVESQKGTVKDRDRKIIQIKYG